MRIYVSSNFYDYTHIIIYFLIIRKYYNPIFYDYAHILNGFWIYLQGGFYMSMNISSLIRTEIYWMQMVLQVWMLLARVHHGINLQMYLKIIVKKCLIMWSGNLFRKKAASHLNILLMICRLDFWHWYLSTPHHCRISLHRSILTLSHHAASQVRQTQPAYCLCRRFRLRPASWFHREVLPLKMRYWFSVRRQRAHCHMPALYQYDGIPLQQQPLLNV